MFSCRERYLKGTSRLISNFLVLVARERLRALMRSALESKRLS
jgi:hypothetical protein